MIHLLIAFDTETTSADPSTTRVVQIAAIQRSFGSPTVDTVLLNELCDPEVEIGKGASDIHGISAEMVKGKPSDKSFCAALVAHIDREVEDGKRVVLCGHNSDGFDVPILERLAGSKITVERLDTLRLARRLYQTAENHKLGSLHEALGLGTADGAHDALVDIKMVLNLVDKAIADSGKTLEELVEWLKTPHIFETVHFGKHKGKKWGDRSIPKWYIDWCRINFNDVDVKATIGYHYGS